MSWVKRIQSAWRELRGGAPVQFGEQDPLLSRINDAQLFDTGRTAGLYLSPWQLEFQRRASVVQARVAYETRGVCRRLVEIWTTYALSDGIQLQVNDETSEPLNIFWFHRDNRNLLSLVGQYRMSTWTLVNGELFVALFGDRGGDTPRVRLIDPLEIVEIVCDENDEERVIGYCRQRAGRGTVAAERIFYPSALATSDEVQRYKPKDYTLPPVPVCVFHGALFSIGRRGNSILADAVDYARAVTQFLNARVAAVTASELFAFKDKLRGGTPQDVERWVNRLQSQLVGLPSDRSKVMSALSGVWVENEGVERIVMKQDTYAASAQTDLHMMLLMAGLGAGIPPHYLGDGDAFRLATATAMELPLRRMFGFYQKWLKEFWCEVLDRVAFYAGIAEPNYDVVFPSILETDRAAQAQAVATIISAMPELASLDAVKKKALAALGVDDPETAMQQLDEELPNSDATLRNVAAVVAAQMADSAVNLFKGGNMQ